MRRKYIEGTKKLDEQLERRNEVLVVSGGALDTGGSHKNVQELFRVKKDDGTVVQRWITDVRYNACKGMANVCRDGGFLAERRLPQWTRKVTCGTKDQVLEDVEARNVDTKNITWKSTDFSRHVAGGTEGREAITFTYVCEHSMLFRVEDFLWVSTNHEERRKRNSMSEWLVVWSVSTFV